MNRVAAISIDLDDTLWPILPTIRRAEQALHEWLAENCPRAVRSYEANLGELRPEVLRLHPDRTHDFAFLRRAGIRMLLERGGYDTSLVDTAYEVFFKARNEVEVFEDVIPALRALGERYILLAVTNGNADLVHIGLDGFFAHTIRAADVGVAKPHPEIFAAVANAAGMPPCRVLHVGDAPHEDINGAQQAGMHAIWVNRFGRRWPEEHSPPTAEIDSLHRLLELLPTR